VLLSANLKGPLRETEPPLPLMGWRTRRVENIIFHHNSKPYSPQEVIFLKASLMFSSLVNWFVYKCFNKNNYLKKKADSLR
jgi:hypothetical protein